MLMLTLLGFSHRRIRGRPRDWYPNRIVPESDHSDLDRVSCRVEAFGVDSVSEDEKHRWENARRSGSRATSGDMSF